MKRLLNFCPRASRALGDEAGQVLPLLMVLLISVFAIGFMLFQVGRASDLRSGAQTGADAAALAAAGDIRDQLQSQAASSGGASLAAISEESMRVAASDYAKRNGGRLVSLERDGLEVEVEVETAETLGAPAEELESEDVRGSADARAELEILAATGAAGGSLGPLPGSGDGNISDEEWKELGEEIDSPPGVPDLIKLGNFLLEHGFAVGEHADFGGVAPPPAHTPTGFHYMFGGRGAIDVNFDPTGSFEMSKINPIVGPVQKLGFRTIWLTTGHYDHIHIDLASSGPLGAGGPAGVLGLEETQIEIKLIPTED